MPGRRSKTGDNAVLLTALRDDKSPQCRAEVVLNPAFAGRMGEDTDVITVLHSAPAFWREIARTLAGHRTPNATTRLEGILKASDDPPSRQGAERALGLQAATGRTEEGASRNSSFETSPGSAFDVHSIFGCKDAPGILYPCAWV
jgi:hypothetical protein